MFSIINDLIVLIEGIHYKCFHMKGEHRESIILLSILNDQMFVLYKRSIVKHYILLWLNNSLKNCSLYEKQHRRSIVLLSILND